MRYRHTIGRNGKDNTVPDRAYYEQQLLVAEEAYRAEVIKTDIARKRRNNAIRDAVHDGGLKNTEVAKLTKLGRARIGQIIKSPKEATTDG